MVIHTDSSIVPDSTVSSPSPPNSPVVRRATFTYGRRNILQSVPESSATLVESSSASRPSFYSAAQSDVKEDIPPSSYASAVPESSGETLAHVDTKLRFSFTRKMDEKNEIDDALGRRETTISPARSDDARLSSFAFSWKARLKQIDEDSDDPDDPIVPPNPSSGPNALLMSRNTGADMPVSLTVQPSSSQRTQPVVADDVFGGSLSSPTASYSQPHSDSALHVSSSATPNCEVIKRPRKRVAVIDSDNDVADSSLDSPAKIRHPVFTPKSRSSPTPPTSDTDLSAAKPQSKGKGRAPIRGVPPLVFNDDRERNSEACHAKEGVQMGKRKDKESRPKIKAPTKKELKETQIDRQRIIADKKVQIARTEPSKYTLVNFFQTIQEELQTVGVKTLPSSDPIQPFSSSPANAISSVDSGVPSCSFGVPTELLAPPFAPSPIPRLSEPLNLTRKVGAPGAVPALEDSDEEDIIGASDLLAAQEKKQKAKQLAEFKKQALARQNAQSVIDDDEDDDLVVESDMHAVADEEADQRRTRLAKHIRPSEGRKRQLMLGGIGSSKADKGHKEGLGRVKNPLDLLKRSARPAFRGAAKHGKDETAGLTSAVLNRLMIESAEKEKAKINRQKEEEWTRRGGKAIRDTDIAEAKTEDWAAMLEKGREAAAKRAQPEVDEGEDSDGSDQDWNPELRGSASPELPEAESGEDGAVSEAEVAMNILTDREDDDETYDKGKARLRRPRRPPAHRAVLYSDEDDDAENVRPLQNKPPFGQVLVPDTSFAEETIFSLNRMPGMTHRGSLSSFDEPTEDENDKENNTQLMFDKSEDKENKAVVRHSPLGPRAGSSVGLEEMIRRTVSMSPSLVSDVDRGQGSHEWVQRRPLKDLRDDEDEPFAFSPSISSFATRLQHPRSPGSQLTLGSPPATLDNQKPLELVLGDTRDEQATVLTKFGLQPGFSDIFKSGSSPSIAFKTSNGGGFSQWSDDQNDSGLDKLRKPVDDLSLTLDVNLQPALEVGENRLRQANAIFEKEQVYIIEAANRKPKKKAELYVNDHGFLTQTRPDVSSPEIYRVASPSQTQVDSNEGALKDDFALQPVQRHPLRTLSVGSLLESPDNTPLKRLRKRGASPTEDATFDMGYRSTPSPSPPKRPITIFDQMCLAQERQEKAAKRKLDKSEFVEAEAEESDEDDQFGFGGRRKADDEEEDGEDQDKTLEGLVDDAEMDDNTMAEDLVMEKVKEHQEEDDRIVEKIHRDAVEGKLRVKKRAGISIDDDSDEDEENEADKRRRRLMAKRRKIDGDNLDELGAHPETRAFFDAYQSDLVDDNEEFANMQSHDIVMDSDDEDGEESREHISYDQIRKELREAIQYDDVPETLDVHDIKWIDDEDNEEEAIAMKTVSTRRASYHPPNRGHDTEFTFERPLATHIEPDRIQKWAKSEARTKNNGTGRSAVGAAVTGHKAKVKAGGGSLRTLASDSTSTVPVAPPKLVKAASMLSVVSDKSSRFG